MIYNITTIYYDIAVHLKINDLRVVRPLKHRIYNNEKIQIDRYHQSNVRANDRLSGNVSTYIIIYTIDIIYIYSNCHPSHHSRHIILLLLFFETCYAYVGITPYLEHMQLSL